MGASFTHTLQKVYSLCQKSIFQRFINHTLQSLNYLIIMFLLLLGFVLKICILYVNDRQEGSYEIGFYWCSGARNMMLCAFANSAL